MTPRQKFARQLPYFFLLGLWLLLGCGSFVASPPPLSETSILATADAIRAMTPLVTPFPTRDECEFPDEDNAQSCMDRDLAELDEHNRQQRTRETEARIEIAIEEATQRAEDAEADRADANHRATLEAEALATATAEFFSTVDASYEVAETAIALSTEEALSQQRGCPGGCPSYPTWCEPPIKGNVSFNSGERIYHMWGDEFYEETKIDPDYGEYYFCTPDEAEAAGFRRAYK